MRGYFTTLGQVEVDACRNAMAGFETVVSQANTVRMAAILLFSVPNSVQFTSLYNHLS